MLRLLLVVALVSGCKDKGGDEAACSKAKVHGPISWIEDDYASALACAKARGVPLVLDLWAPWCHTCLSMQATVFQDPSFAADAKRFVFASLDTDRPANAAAVAKYTMAAWPTFYVVDVDESVLARSAGASSLAQFRGFLDSASAARTGVDGASKHLLAGERALAKGDLDTGEAELSKAVSTAPPGWIRKPDALVSLIHTRRRQGNFAGCLELAETFLDDTGTSASATDFTAIALECANDLKTPGDTRVAVVRERGIMRLHKLLEASNAQLSLDDRSDAMLSLRTTLDAVGRKPEAINLAEKQRQLLEDAIAKAPDPKAAMTYVWHIAEVYAFLGRPLEAVPSLERAAAALPGEYDPLARLGYVYLKADRLTEAAAWTDKAIALAYGPRKASVMNQRANIAARAGDVTTERALRAEIVKLWERMPPGHASPDALAKAKTALANVDARDGAGSAAGSGSGSGTGSGSGSTAP